MAEKPTHEVIHPKLYLSVGGKLQHVESGTQLFLTAKIAEGLGAKVLKLGTKKTVELK